MNLRRIAGEVLRRLGLAALGCLLTFCIYMFLVLLWGLALAPWIRIVHSNWISFLLLLIASLLSYLFVSCILKRIRKTRP